MKKLEILTRPEKLDELRAILEEFGVTGLNIFHMEGYGNQKGYYEGYDASQNPIKLLPMIKVETVVGEAVQIGDTTLVPFVDVTFGFGTGTNHNSANNNHECGGGGGGARMEPSAILVIKGERIELFNIKGNPYSSSFERLIGLVPDLVSKLKSDKYIYINDEEH